MKTFESNQKSTNEKIGETGKYFKITYISKLLMCQRFNHKINLKYFLSEQE